jgi:hypothetical protein
LFACNCILTQQADDDHARYTLHRKSLARSIGVWYFYVGCSDQSSPFDYRASKREGGARLVGLRFRIFSLELGEKKLEEEEIPESKVWEKGLALGLGHPTTLR